MNNTYRSEQRQHISLSTHADEILLSDINSFADSETKSGIINTILTNYMDHSEANIIRAVEEKRNALMKTVSERKKEASAAAGSADNEDAPESRLTKAEKTVIEYLLNDYEESLIERFAKTSFPKDVPFKMRLRNDIFDEFDGQFPNYDYYDGSLGRYIKAIVEDYALQDYFKREEIYFLEMFERINAELRAPLTDRVLLRIRYISNSREISDYRVKPYRMTNEAESQFHYLIGLSKPVNKPDADYKPAIFRLSRIKSISETPSIGSGKITRKEQKAVQDAIKERGIQFLMSDIYEYKILLTPEGEKMFRNILHQRPVEVASKTTRGKDGNIIMFFRCTPFQLRSYFFRFGKEAKILSPKITADTFAKAYREAWQLYDSPI